MTGHTGQQIDVTERPRTTQGAVDAGFRAVFRIFENWGVRSDEAITLLGQPARSTFYKWRQGEVGAVPADTVRRVSYLLGIYKALQLLFTDTRMSDRWIREPNRAFGGQSALQRMLGGDVTDLAAVRAYLDGTRGVW
jgi:hypothetical protein